jgi:hypothetical protein
MYRGVESGQTRVPQNRGAIGSISGEPEWKLDGNTLGIRGKDQKPLSTTQAFKNKKPGFITIPANYFFPKLRVTVFRPG